MQHHLVNEFVSAFFFQAVFLGVQQPESAALNLKGVHQLRAPPVSVLEHKRIAAIQKVKHF